VADAAAQPPPSLGANSYQQNRAEFHVLIAES
jgi:hypothetical protein